MRRTRKLALEYRMWHEHRAPEGTGLDPADVHRRMGSLRKGLLGPVAAASALRDAAVIVDAEAAACVETIKRIDTEYGTVFRRVAYVSGEYLAPYEHLLVARDGLARSRRLAPQLRSLAGRYERRAQRRPSAFGAFRRPHVATLKEAGDTKRLLRALGHKDDEICGRAATALSDLHVTEAVEPLLAILDGRRPGGGEPSKKVRGSVVAALTAFHEPRVADALLRYAYEHADDYDDFGALSGLVQMGDARALEPLAAHLPGGNLPNYAVRLLADLGDPRAIPILRDFIGELERRRPPEGASLRLRDLDLKAARTALARLDPEHHPPQDDNRAEP
ncbi:HEAT repeat domain-containing protein [Actinomadura sp. 7K507]|uniref:HEAT repeat domain-containing protein n=1 Tax=Actinomadura sp. 7K507 TaxID=2530365 RepID=UPI001045703E|nr:HEAT repeat domain-containing protein [Actinomadura sp. 7K507]TDC80152.1 HEAT repeat domain-containing protein [Actinomadura sp. 7K507]